MARCIYMGLLAFSAALSGCPTSEPIPPESDGKTYDLVGDTNDTKPTDFGGHKDTPPPVEQCELEWAFVRTEGGMPSHPIVDADGVSTIVAGTTLRRIDADGQEDCTTPFVADGELLGHPSQNAAGTFYVGTTSGKVIAVTKKCAQKWIFPVSPSNPHAIRQAPALDGNDTLYVLDDRPTLTQISDLGVQAVSDWSYHLSGQPLSRSAPAIVAGNQSFVVVSSNRSVTAVNTGGDKRWEFTKFLAGDFGDWEVTSTIAVTSSRQILFVAAEKEADTYKNHTLYRLQPDSNNAVAVIDSGFPKAIDLTLDTVTAVVISPDQSLYLSTLGHGIIKLDMNGSEIWRFVGDTVSLRIGSVPTLGNDGSIYFTAEPHYFFGVSAEGGQIAQYTVLDGGELSGTSPAISAQGLLLVHIGVQLRAYSCASTGLALSSWPRYQRNNRSSGNLLEAQ
jgi:hypothetical protein